jgi:hypothetical protein
VIQAACNPPYQIFLLFNVRITTGISTVWCGTPKEIDRFVELGIDGK